MIDSAAEPIMDREMGVVTMVNGRQQQGIAIDESIWQQLLDVGQILGCMAQL